MDAAVGHQRNLVVNAQLSDRQPVQCVTKYGSDVLVESSASDEARSVRLADAEQHTLERRTRPRCSSPPCC